MFTTLSKGRTLCAVEPPSPALLFYRSQRFSLIFFQLSKQTCFSHHPCWCLTSQDVSCCSKWWIYQVFHWSLAVTAKTETVILKECTWRSSDRWFSYFTDEVIFSPRSKEQKTALCLNGGLNGGVLSYFSCMFEQKWSKSDQLVKIQIGLLNSMIMDLMQPTTK